ncbi:ephrin-B1 [Rhopalosiphum maidis]|uniref:ephrin-B1 n=1 Tax=Rhopalosiphum maidis TaxID=43146 RepID=UPI000F00AADB|nr:ephrin-B1 [Rhopalosiphum maidis]
MVLFDNLFGFPGLPGCLRFFSPSPSAAAGRRPASATMRGVSCTKITSCLTLVLLICFETVLLSTVSDCTKSFTVHWNTSNSIFRIDNTDHIIDVNKGNQPFEYDQVNIVCPVYAPGTHESDAEKYIIYNVSKEEYDMCRITNPNPRIIAYCDKPYKLMYVTITFRSFTPQPGGLEFQPGQDYYFISTSSKDDIHRRIGGRCSTNNMKVVFKVCCRPEDQQNNQNLAPRPTQNAGNPQRLPVPGSTHGYPARPPSVYASSTQQPSLAGKQPPFGATGPSVHNNNKPSHKKSSEYDKHPNEVVKNEELTYNGAGATAANISAKALAVLYLVAFVAYERIIRR